MSIKFKVLFAFMGMVAIGLIQAGFGLQALRSITAAFEASGYQAVNQVDSARSAWISFVQADELLSQELQMIERNDGSKSLARFNELIEQTLAALQVYLDNAPDTEGRKIAEDAAASLKTWKARALVLLGVDGQTAIPSPHVLAQARQQIGGHLDKLVSLARANASEAHVAAEATNALAWKVLAVLALFSLIAGVGLAFLIAIRIVNPLVGLERRIKLMVSGDMTSPVLFLGRKDEVGGIASAVEFFREQFLARSDDERRQKEKEAALEAESRNAAARAIEAERDFVRRCLGKGLERLAAKDLTYRITEQLPEAYRKLQDDFNAAMVQIEEVISSVSTSTRVILTGTQEISSASNDLSRRTESQAARLEETAAAVADVTSKVKSTASGASHARGVVASAKEDAAKSGEVVRKTIESITSIEKTSGHIAQIVGVIDEIAFQTNLLALNAGVEAARAGDTGRGFAVVAQEVRALAQRSAEAAKEIRALIASSRMEVAQGVQLVGETGSSLDRIVSRVLEIDGVVNAIASSAQDQALSLADVNAAVGQMDQTTQQNATMVEQATAATVSLVHETDELDRMISSFVTNARDLLDNARRKDHGRSTVLARAG